MRHPILTLTLVLATTGALAQTACGPSRDDVEKEISKANYCTVPADCVSVGSYCPFGCYILVNANEEQDIYDLIQEYYDAHPGEQCMYDCVAVSGFDCQEGRCVTLDASQ